MYMDKSLGEREEIEGVECGFELGLNEPETAKYPYWLPLTPFRLQPKYDENLCKVDFSQAWKLRVNEHLTVLLST